MPLGFRIPRNCALPDSEGYFKPATGCINALCCGGSSVMTRRSSQIRRLRRFAALSMPKITYVVKDTLLTPVGSQYSSGSRCLT